MYKRFYKTNVMLFITKTSELVVNSSSVPWFGHQKYGHISHIFLFFNNIINTRNPERKVIKYVHIRNKYTN